MFACVLLGTLLTFCFNFCLSKFLSKSQAKQISFIQVWLIVGVAPLFVANVESIYQSPLLWSLCLNISHKIGTSNLKTNLFRHASLCQIYCDSHILSRRLSCCNEHKPFVRSICFVCSKYFSTHSYVRG